MVCTIDLAASLAALLGREVPKGAFPDSVDVSGVLLGKKGAKGRSELVQQGNRIATGVGFRKGDWKLIRRPEGKGKDRKIRRWLFDLSKDPGESTDLSASHPEKVRELEARLDELGVPR